MDFVRSLIRLLALTAFSVGATGYRLTLVRLDGDKAVSYEPFVTGWNQPDGVLGRPVDLLVMADGSVLVADDNAGVIYRITYRAPG